ncbi:SRPBCC domain-containing protein [Paenibacillus sp. MER 99-2]|uniref:SRPBCC family protein n=1 Tax=Paenibacillus sp. MER 99-2 TaxID=2939572 RepID=UPI00203C4F88|nr:SRPBCC domain-containing protein [Paenibacillus sp. MER 99-2]MCM3173802.1 SRPBCC domain-containing protein [Paenibacillus sp. MER 99-2]
MDSASALPDIRQQVLLHAPVSKVWEIVSTAQGMGRWFMPSNMEATEGHEFILEAGPFGQSPCKVIEVKPEHKLSFRWGKDWTLTFELSEQPEGTRFTLTHSGWDADQLTEFGQAHAIVRERMEQGWVGIVQKLAQEVQ